MKTKAHENLKFYIQSTFNFGGTGHVIYTAYYIIKHRLNKEEADKYIKEEIKRSHKTFFNHGIQYYVHFPKGIIDAEEDFICKRPYCPGGKWMHDAEYYFEEAVNKILNVFEKLNEEAVHTSE